ncbi:response regulator [Caballeronia grimmiae]
MKVLIVEDDSAIAANLYDYLEANGYEVDLASNGRMGLAMAIAYSWDAILLDLSLPHMDGLTLCRKLREEARRDAPVLMLTALTYRRTRSVSRSPPSCAHERGGLRICIEPVDVEALLAVMTRIADAR